MASDLSNIFKDELSNTLEQLLSKSASVESINSVSGKDNTSSQFIEVIVKFLLAIIAQIHLASMLKQSDNDRRRRLRNSGSGDRFGVLESKF